MPTVNATTCHWLRTGDEAFPLMLDAIRSARISIRLEIYIYANDALGREFRDALVGARRRGVTVRVLNDAFGSMGLASSFWQPLQVEGGEVRWFNPGLLRRLGFRDHRKMLVCDDSTGFIGGFNISIAYVGDGVASGWCDLGLRLTGPLVAGLSAAFDDMFARADTPAKPLALLRRAAPLKAARGAGDEWLFSGPGQGRNPFSQSLRRALAHARTVRIIAAYFLPTRRIRRALMRLARRGGRVQLILPGKSDVLLSQLAGRSLYRRLLKAGVEIYEYEPQILHAKLILIDHTAYAGSSNLDPRSLFLNYELMLRLQNPEAVAAAGALFEEKLAHCRRIEMQAWRESRSLLGRLEQRWAYFLLVHVDPAIARWRYK